jgi:hypothetical protein
MLSPDRKPEMGSIRDFCLLKTLLRKDILGSTKKTASACTGARKDLIPDLGTNGIGIAALVSGRIVGGQGDIVPGTLLEDGQRKRRVVGIGLFFNDDIAEQIIRLVFL